MTDTSTTLDGLAAAPEAPASTGMSARDRLVIGLLLISTFVVILNETIMSVALPHLMADLAIPASTAQWLTTAFMLTMAVVIPVTGFLMQRFNTRPVFMLAMTLFSTGTLISAIAPGFEVLLVGRIVQASGTAVMMPLLMTTIMTLVPPQSRGKTMGMISIVISVAPAIGPTVSGLILQVLEWRWMFILVLPIAHRRADPRHRARSRTSARRGRRRSTISRCRSRRSASAASSMASRRSAARALQPRRALTVAFRAGCRSPSVWSRW